LVIAALLAALATAAPFASPSPQEIFDRAFTRLASYPVAPYAVEIATRHEVTHSSEPGRGGVVDFSVRYTFRSSDRSENFASYPTLSEGLPQAVIVRAELGAFAWSMRRDRLTTPQRAGEPTSPDVPEPLKTIAHVVAYGPPNYAIDLAGTESVDGHPCYHLRLRPLSDPVRHNLRELWVDTTSFDLWKARFDGSYRPIPPAPSSLTTFVSIFAPVGAYWIVSRQHWTWTDVGNALFIDIDMEVNKIVFPATLPDFLFDQAEYDKRQRAGENDPLDAILNGQ
jgi:hypothetical protein